MTSTAFRQSSKLRSRGKSILVFNGTITGTPALATGSGTENDPYQISTAEGLKWFRDKVNNAKTPDETKICVELTEDIDLSGEEWSPIGIGQGVYWGSLSYSGTFDGKGHTIKNLSIDNSSANFVGLFGYVLGGTIRNLTVSGSVKGSGHTGGIAGGADGGTFENCANLCVVQSDSTEGGTTGGIIGFALNMDYVLIVRDCYNVGSITGRHAGGKRSATAITPVRSPEQQMPVRSLAVTPLTKSPTATIWMAR